MEQVNIHPKGTPGDLQGMPSCKDMRETPKNYGKRVVVGVIRNGIYCDPETGEPIVLSNKKLVHKRLNINKIGGVENNG